MTQRQYRRVEKNQLQVHNNSRRSCERGRPNSAAQPHYQSISSTKGRGGGGGCDSAGLSPPPPPSSHPHSSSKARYKKPTRQGGKSRETVATFSSGSTIVQKTSSEAYDAPASEAPSESSIPYMQGDGGSISKSASCKSPSETTYSAVPTPSLRGEPSHGVSLQFGSLNPSFANEIQGPHNSFRQETAESTSSMSRQQKSKDSEISHLQLKAKIDVRSPHSSSKQKKHNSFKPVATLSTLSIYGKQHMEDVEWFKNETPHFQLETKREMHGQVASVAPAVNSTHTSLSIPGATSSYQQPYFQLQFGMSRPQTWSQGIASASVEMPVQSPIEDSSQFQEYVYFTSFQPYALQPQEMMYYSQGLNLPTTVGHQFGSQFVNANGISLLHVQNDVRNANPRISIKITHPETKEELKLDELEKPNLDGGSSGTRAHLNMQLQAQPLAYGHSHVMNYFSHTQSNPFFLLSPSSVTFFGTQMFPMKSRPEYLDYGTRIHGAVMGSNSEHVSSALLPSSSKLDLHSVGGNILSPASVNSVVNDKSEAIKSTRPQRFGFRQGKSKIHSEMSIKPPPKVVIKPAISVLSSHRAVPSAVSTDAVYVEGGLIRDAVSDDSKESIAVGDSDYLSKSEEIKIFEQPIVDNIHEEQNVYKLRLPETSEKVETGELKDWQKVTEISTPELHISRKVELYQNMSNAAVDSIIVPGKKKYSRDFLLTFSSQFVELPTDIELVGDMIKRILVFEVLDDQGYMVEDGSKWIKTPASSASEQEKQSGFSWGNFGVHSSQGGTYGRTLNGQTPHHCDGGFAIRSLPHSTSHYGRRNKGPDADRWQLGVLSNKGLISLPQSSLQAMHKAEQKYEVHKVIDVNEAKQRQLKAILNKLTPQNFERLFQQVKEVNIDNTMSLSGLISQIFDKALMEPTFCEMYANFCYHLASELPNFVEGQEKITFKRLLLNKCQEEFVRGEREQAEANRIEEDGEARLSEEKREEKRIHARRRMLGNIRLIGELYKKKMLTEGVMHDCIQKLLGNHDYPDEEDVEALCKLMSTVGEIIDHPKAKEQMDTYFKVMKSLSNNSELSSRMRFMLKDAIDLRKNKWQQRRKVEGPKKIEELHIDAAQERRALVSQRTCGSNVISSNKKISANFSPRPSTFPSPQNSRVSAFRAMSPHVHGFASQDVRLEDKHLYKQGRLPAPITHRSSDENPPSPGRQVRQHVKRISVRGPPMLYGSLLSDLHTGFVESRRIPTSPNGYSSISEQKQYSLKQH